MEIVRTAGEIRARLDRERAEGRSIGMVGTSGAMHDGHLSLVRRAAAENDVSMLFWGGAPADLEFTTASVAYERDPRRDFPLAEAAGTQLLFAPTARELYPAKPMTKVTVPAMSADVAHMEDPAHLDLVGYTMCKLWNIVGPCRNYFGEKDWQQLVVFQRIAKDLLFPVEVIGSPTIRDSDGLALSSRNAHLTPEERAQAPRLYQALSAVKTAAQAGETSASRLERLFREALQGVGEVTYFTPVDALTMAPLDQLARNTRIIASLKLGNVRLMDNIGIDTGGDA